MANFNSAKLQLRLGFIIKVGHMIWASQVALVVKNLPVNAGYVRDEDLIPGSGSRWRRRILEKPLRHFCLENPMDRRAW